MSNCCQLCCVYCYYSSSGVGGGNVGVVCCCCCSPALVPVALASKASVVVVVFILGEAGLSSIPVVTRGGIGIPLSHSHNLIVAARVLGSSSCVPTTIMPLNGARLPVALLSNTAITSPFPSKVSGLYRIISLNVMAVVSLSSSEKTCSLPNVLTVSVYPGTKEINAVPLLVMLIVSPVSGTLIVPFPMNVTTLCVSFI